MPIASRHALLAALSNEHALAAESPDIARLAALGKRIVDSFHDDLDGLRTLVLATSDHLEAPAAIARQSLALAALPPVFHRHRMPELLSAADEALLRWCELQTEPRDPEGRRLASHLGRALQRMPDDAGHEDHRQLAAATARLGAGLRMERVERVEQLGRWLVRGVAVPLLTERRIRSAQTLAQLGSGDPWASLVLHVKAAREEALDRSVRCVGYPEPATLLVPAVLGWVCAALELLPCCDAAIDSAGHALALSPPAIRRSAMLDLAASLRLDDGGRAPDPDAQPPPRPLR